MVPAADRARETWLTAGEDRDQRNAERCGKMQETLYQRRPRIARRQSILRPGRAAARSGTRARALRARCARCARARPSVPHGNSSSIPRTECLTECDPMRLRPLFFRPSGGVQQHSITRASFAKAVRGRAQNRARPAACNRGPVRSGSGCARLRANRGRHGSGHRKTPKPAARGCWRHRSRGADRAPRGRSMAERKSPCVSTMSSISLRTDGAQACGNLGSWSPAHTVTFASAARRPG